MLKSQDSIRLGDVIPNFEADSTHGKCSLYQVIGDKSYGLLFSHPLILQVSSNVHNNSTFPLHYHSIHTACVYHGVSNGRKVQRKI